MSVHWISVEKGELWACAGLKVAVQIQGPFDCLYVQGVLWSQQAIGYISSVDIKRESNINAKPFALLKRRYQKRIIVCTFYGLRDVKEIKINRNANSWLTLSLRFIILLRG
jgi:hypothetical protein